MRAHRGFLVALLTTGCSGGGGSTPDAVPDVPLGLPTCAADGFSEAVIVSRNGDVDAIEVYKLDGGQLVETGLAFTDVELPDDVAVNSDGTEAMVSFGGFGHSYGVVILSVNPLNPAMTTVKQKLVIGTDRVPFGLAYADDEHAVLATAAGPDGHTVIALDKAFTGGMWSAGMTAPVPSEWPLALQHRDDGVVLARADLSSDTNTDFYVLRRDSTGAWPPVGTPAMVTDTPLDMAISPDGSAMYAAAGDPADKVSISNLDAKGLLHVLHVSDSGFGNDQTVALPGPGSMIAASPDGQFVVVDSPVYELDPNTNTPITHVRRFFTISLNAPAAPGTVKTQTDPWPALLLYGLGVSSRGYVVRSRQMYASQAPEPEQMPLDVLLPDGTGNMQTCSTKFLTGQGRFAIATYVSKTLP